MRLHLDAGRRAAQQKPDAQSAQRLNVAWWRLLGWLGSVAALSGTPTRVETLDIAEGSSLKAELSAEESYVKPGDVALETKGDEYEGA